MNPDAAAAMQTRTPVPSMDQMFPFEFSLKRLFGSLNNMRLNSCILSGSAER
jgi:hypothetical protein